MATRDCGLENEGISEGGGRGINQLFPLDFCFNQFWVLLSASAAQATSGTSQRISSFSYFVCNDSASSGWGRPYAFMAMSARARDAGLRIEFNSPCSHSRLF